MGTGRIAMGVLLALLLAWAAVGRSQGDGGERVFFSQADPAGDDRGAGTLLYPTHDAFAPHHGLYDLQHFRVSQRGEFILFELTFGAVTNPFSAPEGFYHQRVDIYMDTVPGEGSLQPFQPGPQVRFHPSHPWDLRLRVAPFGGTRLHSYKDPVDSPGRGRGLKTALLSDGKTIGVWVPVEVLGVPQRWWRYYVLVGGYDHFGPDEWRDVQREPSPWFFGGVEGAESAPRVVDLLAPAWGWGSQARQLGRFGGETGQLAMVRPVGPREIWGPALLGASGIGLAAAARWRGWWPFRRARRREKRR